MRCNWSTTASRVLRTTVHPKPYSFDRNTLVSLPLARFSIQLPRANYHRTLFTSAAAHASARLSPNNEPGPVNSFVSEPESLTPPQISRAAAQAVRMSFQNGAIEDAYFIVNSIRFAKARGNITNATKLLGLRRSLRNFEANAIQFGSNVSPRLSAHALLHGLIRGGFTAKASKLANLMMKNEIPLRTTTLQALISTLAPGNASLLGGRAPSRPLISTQSDILFLKPSMVQDKGAQYALQLLHVARRTRNQRTDGMYETLICYCIINGEIVIASLLFGLIVKDWQRKKCMTVQFDGSNPEAGAMDIDGSSTLEKKRLVLKDRLQKESIYPSAKVMKYLLRSIDENLSADGAGEQSELSRRATLQALANLATLLDRQQLPFHSIGALIKTLYNCPRVPYNVWVQETGYRGKEVNAYLYFHAVLGRLINTLPLQRLHHNVIPSSTRATSNRLYPILPPLHISSYNALLHYALRHRLSPALANTILDHMTSKQRNPLKPDIVTYNILIRSGTLLRRSSIADRAAEILREMQENADHPITIASESTPPQDPEDVLQATALSLKAYTGTAVALIPWSADIQVKADAYTLSSYIAHLTSTGKSHIIVKILFDIFPGLDDANQRSWNTMTNDQRRDRQNYLKQAAAHGPYVFTTVLNALYKAGEMSLAGRVWRLAKKAERASRDPEFSPGAEPWCLPVQAYTIMLRCWAKFRCGGDELHHKHTDQEVRWRMGAKVYNSMRTGSQDVYMDRDGGQEGDEQDIELEIPLPIPKPDARFFNAALDLYSRNVSMRPRRARTTLAHWRQHLRATIQSHASFGMLPKHFNHMLQEVGEDMANHGYAMPPGLRYIFVGRWAQGTWNREPPPELDRRPFAFIRRRRRFYPHSIPIHKSRGLPCRRKSRQPAKNVLINLNCP